MKTKPLGNYCLIEVDKEYESVSRFQDNDMLSASQFKTGKLLEFNVFSPHITAAAGQEFEPDVVHAHLTSLRGKTVRWEEHAESGQTFEQDGKTYALIPWWRLISYEED